MRRQLYLPLAIISVLGISTSIAHAQVFAPSTLQLASAEQETKKYVGPAITEKPVVTTPKKQVAASTKKTAQATTKKNTRAIAMEPVRPLSEPVRPIARPYGSETRQSVDRYTFRTPRGKKESVPVITQYYPKQIVYPLAKVDRHIDRKLMQAATIAQERAHAHSRSRCWHYVKDALLASGVID